VNGNNEPENISCRLCPPFFIYKTTINKFKIKYRGVSPTFKTKKLYGIPLSKPVCLAIYYLPKYCDKEQLQYSLFYLIIYLTEPIVALIS